MRIFNAAVIPYLLFAALGSIVGGVIASFLTWGAAGTIFLAVIGALVGLRAARLRTKDSVKIAILASIGATLGLIMFAGSYGAFCYGYGNNGCSDYPYDPEMGRKLFTILVSCIATIVAIVKVHNWPYSSTAIFIVSPFGLVVPFLMSPELWRFDVQFTGMTIAASFVLVSALLGIRWLSIGRPQLELERIQLVGSLILGLFIVALIVSTA